MGIEKSDIALVIVNYKVKEYIANLLNSVEKAKASFKLQVIIVDNNSGDDSEEYLTAKYPEITYIANKENLGFGKANNQGFEQVNAKYTLVINPDTLVSEDTFTKLYEHMENNELCGACGCKILNPDGTFAPESKRVVPTLGTALSKVLGLNSLFPKSKLFGKYYMGWLPQDEINKVPVLSGAFMFWRTKTLKQLGGFDERFFMYGEDIDLCYRVQNTEYYIDYVPTTSIIHYKGESTRRGDLRYIRIFNKALYQFFEKHYSSNYSFFFRFFVFTAISLRGFLSIFTNNLRLIGFVASDLLLLNVSVILGFLIRFNFSLEVFTNLQSLRYLWINLLASVLYVILGSTLDLFRPQKSSISNQLKAIFASFSAVAAITFFVRNLAYSRLAIIFGLVSAIVLMVMFRLIQINFSSSFSKARGRIRRSKILLVGNREDTEVIEKKINSRPDWNYDVIGTIGISDDGNGYLGTLPQLKDFVKAYQIEQIFFALKSISYKDMLRQISLLQKERVFIKLIPDSMDFILGKSNVEYLESIPLVEVGFEYSKGFNRFLKRSMDLVIGVPFYLMFSVLSLPFRVFNNSKKIKVGKLQLYSPAKRNKILNYHRLYGYVISGKLSLVGASFNEEYDSQYEYKSGLTGMVQLNSERIHSETEAENYDLYYLQNYSIWMDIDLLLKTVFSKYKLLENLKD